MFPVIDIVVLEQSHSPVHTIGEQHIIELDEIPITKERFRQIFYTQDTFHIEPGTKTNPTLLPYISLTTQTYRKNSFSLMGELLGHLETDLNISRNAFTPSSLIEMQKTITRIQSLADLTCSTLCSLKWSDIQHMLEHDYTSSTDAILVVNVIFKSDTVGALSTNVKFPYKVSRV
jgi:hypothetical protein